VEIGAKPESILLLTFTRRAAASMLSRAAALADARCQRVSGGTFHSLGHSVLRKYSEIAGVASATLRAGPGRHRRSDRSPASAQIKFPRGGEARHFLVNEPIAAIFSMMVNKVQSLKAGAEQRVPAVRSTSVVISKALFKSFEQFKRGRHMLTYDDLLVRLREALEAASSCANDCQTSIATSWSTSTRTRTNSRRRSSN
jgi:DNA helicase-2/ATP-dependent DNA helicase PcrA